MKKLPTDFVDVMWQGRNGLACESVRCLRKDGWKEVRRLYDTYHSLMGGCAITTEAKASVQHHYEIVR